MLERILSFRIVQISAALGAGVGIFASVVIGFYSIYRFVTWAGN